MAGKIIGAKVIARVDFFNHSGVRYAFGWRIQELHSTKGWQRSHVVGKKDLPYDVMIGEFHRCPNHKRRDPSDAGRWMRNRRPFSGEPDEKAKLRHAWYRKQKAREAFRASVANQSPSASPLVG